MVLAVRPFVTVVTDHDETDLRVAERLNQGFDPGR